MPFKCVSVFEFFFFILFIVEGITDVPHFVLFCPRVFLLKITVGQKDFLRKRIHVDFNKKNMNIYTLKAFYQKQGCTSDMLMFDLKGGLIYK